MATQPPYAIVLAIYLSLYALVWILIACITELIDMRTRYTIDSIDSTKKNVYDADDFVRAMLQHDSDTLSSYRWRSEQ